MPRGRRSNLSRRSTNARRVRNNRVSETPRETRQRLHGMITRNMRRILEESSESHENRLSALRSQRHGDHSERRRRLHQQRQDLREEVRASESAEDRADRLENERVRVLRVITACWSSFNNAAFDYNAANDYSNNPLIAIGQMNTVCRFCNAYKYNGERPGLCCSGGKVRVPDIPPPPVELRNLLDGTSAMSSTFLKNIRHYNNAFQMTSFGCERVREVGFMPTFKIQGQVYHLIGPLLPNDTGNERPVFLQVFFMGNNTAEVETRRRNNPTGNLSTEILCTIQNILHEFNPYVELFKKAIELMPSPECKLVIRADRAPGGFHAGTFNAPTIDEVAIIIANETNQPRDIVLHKRGGGLQRISEFHPSYDALQYPLIFWNGQNGFHFNIPQIINDVPSLTKKVSAMDFYASMLMLRENQTVISNWLLAYGELTHQLLVDIYAKVESQRLSYIITHQAQLRSTEYINLQDALHTDTDANLIGVKVILPSSFIGGPRHMHEYAQDCLSYVKKFGKPDLFITFTCNPEWEEIKCMQYSGQDNIVRHDIVARIFHLKLTKLIDCITKGCIFGEVQCWCYTIEWQKRGLPHSHILVWCQHKIRPNQIDQIISAEIPDERVDPVLFQIITKQMIHGPCGVAYANPGCIKDGKCTKKYPRQFISETRTDTDGYPLYRRRKPTEGGHIASKRTRVITVENGRQVCRYQDVDVDNRNVVPHSPLLCKLFNAHINVELCSSVSAIKYICKYVYKGSDRSLFAITRGQQDGNEVDQYKIGRYISSNEAVWRIFGFPIHRREPAVQHLTVHLENGQRVYFTAANAADRAQSAPRTTLTEFFVLCQVDEFARSLLYVEVPTYYTWTSGKKWQRRKRGTQIAAGIFASDAIGRVYTVHPTSRECYYLRMLLHVVRGPTSFYSLKTVDGFQCSTFHETCLKLGLLEDDQQWQQCLEEAAACQSPSKLRELFAIILTQCYPENPLQLWDHFKRSMAEDVLRRAQLQINNLSIEFNSDIENATLTLLENKVMQIAGKYLSEFGLPTPIRDGAQRLNHDYLRETTYDIGSLQSYLNENESKLLEIDEQRYAYQKVLEAKHNDEGGIYFLDAPGGTGKTFLLNLLLAKVRSTGIIALATASSGIAATLMQGGRTAHSTFHIPIDLTRADNPICNLNAHSPMAAVLRACKLIVWDECTMAHKKALEAVDRTLQDCRNNTRLMGGVLMLLAGDFRQTLPIVPRGTIADELSATIKESNLWRFVKTFSLKLNMRAHLSDDVDAKKFSDQLLQLGNGQLNDRNDYVVFPDNFCNFVSSLSELKQSVFPDIAAAQHQESVVYHKWLCERAILAPTNDCVNDINKIILQEIMGPSVVYTSVDTNCNNDDSVEWPVEFLNSLSPAGMPAHKLELKIGTPIMLLRNIDPPRLCNGTRLCVTKCLPHVIVAVILTGCAKNTEVLIPRIPIIYDKMPLRFKRLQFPVRISFAMTINKAQGQSLAIAGVNLEKPCFSHGQLYVACSRVGSPRNLYIYVPENKTTNVVYANVLK